MFSQFYGDIFPPSSEDNTKDFFCIKKTVKVVTTSSTIKRKKLCNSTHSRTSNKLNPHSAKLAKR